MRATGKEFMRVCHGMRRAPPIPKEQARVSIEDTPTHDVPYICYYLLMRYVSCLAISCAAFWTLVQAEAQSVGFDDGRPEILNSGESDVEPYGRELERERYKTALARERAQQAYLHHQAQLYESQRAQQEIYRKRSEHERRYEERTDDITNANQLANTITSVVRQIQVLSGRRGGW